VEADLLLVQDLEASGIEVHVATEDGSRGERGLATAVVERLIDERPPSAIYACGPHGMLHAVESLAARRRLPAQLAWEAYMRCGVGICGSCEHGGMLLCADGPVLQSNGETSEEPAT
jgi:dihydroorotate dehydrogenase electron transfer subunit